MGLEQIHGHKKGHTYITITMDIPATDVELAGDERVILQISPNCRALSILSSSSCQVTKYSWLSWTRPLKIGPQAIHLPTYYLKKNVYCKHRKREVLTMVNKSEFLGSSCPQLGSYHGCKARWQEFKIGAYGVSPHANVRLSAMPSGSDPTQLCRLQSIPLIP